MVGDGGQRFIAKILQPLGIFVENLTGRRQLYGLAGSIKQPVSILLLQLADLRTDRRLRTEYFFPGAGKTALPGDFQECDQLVEVHGLAEL